jgi:hypothetical protein
VWAWNGPRKIRVHFLKLYYGRRLGMTNDVSCICCGNEDEKIRHLFHDYEPVRKLRDPLIDENYWAIYFSLGLMIGAYVCAN